MTLEPKLIKVFIIELAEFHCQPSKCPDKPKLGGDAIYDENEPDVSRELETTLGFTLHLGQRISGRQEICVQGVAAVGGVSEITDPVRGVETATMKLSRWLDVSRPWDNQSPKRHIGPRLIATQSALLNQVITELAKPEPGIIVSEMRSSDHPQPHIGVARSVAVAVLQAEANHPRNHEIEKSRIDKHRRCHNLGENIQKVEHIWIGEQGQVNELLDLPASQQRPDLVVF